jgi:hypothetical protein
MRASVQPMDRARPFAVGGCALAIPLHTSAQIPDLDVRRIVEESKENAIHPSAGDWHVDAVRHHPAAEE